MTSGFIISQLARDIRSIAQQLTDWCRTPDTLAQRQQELNELASRVAIPGATQRTAELLLSELASGTQQSESVRAA